MGLTWVHDKNLGKIEDYTMSTEVVEPPVAEDVVSGTEAEDVEGKGKKRGRVKAEDDPRREFEVPGEMVDEDGKIKVWSSDCGYIFGTDVSCHKPLKAKMFAEDEIYVDYKVGAKQHVISVLQEEVTSMIKNREQFGTIEDPDVRKRMKKTKKLKNQIKALMEQLAVDGCNVDILDDDD